MKKLKAKKRTLRGRKVKQLRRQGILPANIYGRGITSQAIELPQQEFLRIFKESGETEVIELMLEGEKEARPVLVRHLQLHPVTEEILHVDFLQVNLKEEITAAVPLVFVGQSPAVKEGRGILLELMDELEVRALPTQIPSEIKVDISQLQEVNDFLTVADLPLPDGVTAEKEAEELICKIEAQKTAAEEEEEEAAEETEAAAEEAESSSEATPQEEKASDAATN